MADQQAYLQSLFTKSAQALQNGDFKTAGKGFEKVAKKAKDNAVVWYNLGLSNQYMDDHRGAVSAYRKAISIKPDLHDAIVNLGIAYKVLGDIDKANDVVGKLLKRDPAHIRGNNLMGSLLAERGKPLEAKEILSKSLASDPNNDEVRLNLANVELTLGNLVAAETLLLPLLSAHPLERQYLELQTEIFLCAQKYDEAQSSIEKIKSIAGSDVSLIRLELSLFEARRAHFQVVELGEKLLKSHPRDAGLWNSLGNAYYQLDGVSKASDAYEKAVRLEPHRAEYLSNRGLAYASLGDRDNAEHFYRRAIDADPRHGDTYFNLAMMKRFKSLDDDDAVMIKRLWDERGSDTNLTRFLAFALGKVYDDCGEYAQSFQVYDIGNKIKFEESRVDLGAYFNHMDRIPSVLKRPPTNVCDRKFEHQPIFVLGMPRSGTTLVEQILSRHPDVTGCGELPCIERAIARLERDASSPRVYPDGFLDIDSATCGTEAAEYHSWVSRSHDIHTPYFVDKMPFNFTHIWLIKAMFPDAPIINCQRHPLDVVLSNYFQMYGSDISFVYNLEVLTNYYVRYFRLMKSWNQVFEGQICNVLYEGLVADHETQTRKLIDDIGLGWNDNCLDSKRTKTVVRTASIWQVRQGIYTSSTERWRNYAEQLAPAAEILMKENILNERLEFVLGQEAGSA